VSRAPAHAAPGPLAAWEADIAAGGFAPDPAQRAALEHLEALHRAVLARPGALRRLLRRPPGAAGVYLWGDVGRGKTYLMDLFYDALPAGIGRRVHFHAFMLEVHAGLRARRGEQDPIAGLADALARRWRVLCLDELQVHDVADAMVLGPLLRGLVGAGVRLVATSNRHPQALYRHGLQRERFLPTVALIEERLAVLGLDGPIDYRARALADLGRYYTPLGAQAEAALARCFAQLAPAHVRRGSLRVDGREIPTRGYTSDVGWFDFDVLCRGPRAARDYLLLAERFHTLILANVPAMGADEYDAAHRFMNLVDVLYDAGTHLIVSAAAPPAELYRAERLGFEFRRTVSRLTEMQSRQYLRARRMAD
jgi:cell division protein ZapE